MSDQQYRVLGAALALGEFTVEDLARLSGVKEATVRTTLGRNGEWVKSLGRAEPKGPGGRVIRYRTRPERVDELRGQLRDLASAVQLEKAMAPRSAGVPLELIAAEATLVERLPRIVAGTERANLLNLARRNFGAVTRTNEQPGIRVAAGLENVRFHSRTVRTLIKLIDLIEVPGEVDQGAVVADAESGVSAAGELIDEWGAQEGGAYRDAVIGQLRRWRTAVMRKVRETHPRVLVIDGATGNEGRDLTVLVARMLHSVLGKQPDSQPLWARPGLFMSVDAVLERADDASDVFVITVPASSAAGAADFIQRMARTVPGESLVVISDAQEPTLLNSTLRARGTYLLSPGLEATALEVKIRQSVESRRVDPSEPERLVAANSPALAEP